MLDKCRIVMANESDTEEILALYKTHLYGAADWDENYPSRETIAFDLSRDALFVMKNSYSEIIATISIDSDDAVENLDCWNESLKPGGEVSRICVRDDMKNHGIARIMMKYTFNVMKEQGYKSVHILVKTGHIVALKSYKKLGFQEVGECSLFGKEFICLETEI